MRNAYGLRAKRVALLLCLFSTLGASTLHAGPILDQINVVVDDNPPTTFEEGGVISDSISVAQTFTVGISGLLTSLELQIAGYTGTGGNIYTSIYNIDSNGNPTGTALTEGSPVAYSSLPVYQFASVPFVSVSLTSPLSVTSGDTLAIVLTTDSSAASSTWNLLFPNPYTGGVALSTYAGFWQPLQLSIGGNVVTGDFGFKTFVEPIAAPEPASVTLLGTGLGLWALRRRKRA